MHYLGACGANHAFKSSLCNPALNDTNPDQPIQVDVLISGEETLLDVLDNVVLNEINEDYIKRLFATSTGIISSGLARVAIAYPGINVSYSPFTGVGSLLVNNPAFPEFDLQLLNQSELRVTASTEIYSSLKREGKRKKGTLVSLGITPVYYTREIEIYQGFVSEVASSDLKALKRMKKSESFDVDVGLLLSFHQKISSSFGLAVRNVVEDSKMKEVESTFVHQFLRSYELHNSTFFPTPLFKLHAFSKLGLQGEELFYTIGTELVLPRIRFAVAFSESHFSYGLASESDLIGMGVQLKNNIDNSSQSEEGLDGRQTDNQLNVYFKVGW